MKFKKQNNYNNTEIQIQRTDGCQRGMSGQKREIDEGKFKRGKLTVSR